MRCKCGFENAPDARFCGNCRLALSETLGGDTESAAVPMGATPVSTVRAPIRRPLTRKGTAVIAAVVVLAAAGYWWMNRPPERFKSDNGGLYAINLNGKHGFMDRSGKTVISPQFEWVDGFSEELAGVRVGNRVGYIDTKGAVVITPQFDDAGKFRNGRAPVKLCCGQWYEQSGRDRFGVIGRDGKYIGSPDLLWVGWFFSGDLAPVKTAAGALAYMDRSGRTVLSGKFENLSASGFTEGLAPAASGGKWGFIDKAGKWVIDPQFDGARNFANGLAPVTVGGRTGYIDKKGKFIVNPQYDSADEFYEGLASFATGGKYGFIDTSGRVVIEAKFPVVRRFRDGLAPIKAVDGWGFIDRTGKMVINPQFDWVLSFQNGLARVNALGKEAYITKTGAFVVDPFPGTTIEKESARLAAEALESQIDAATAAGALYLKEFLGTWTDGDNSYLLELSYANGRIRIRQCYGENTEGTEFFGRYSDGTITAIGRQADFYKFHLPEFKVLPTGELLHDCGVCLPDRLTRTTKRMPKITFKPPVNRD